MPQRLIVSGSTTNEHRPDESVSIWPIGFQAEASSVKSGRSESSTVSPLRVAMSSGLKFKFFGDFDKRRISAYTINTPNNTHNKN